MAGPAWSPQALMALKSLAQQHPAVDSSTFSCAPAGSPIAAPAAATQAICVASSFPADLPSSQLTSASLAAPAPLTHVLAIPPLTATPTLPALTATTQLHQVGSERVFASAHHSPHSSPAVALPPSLSPAVFPTPSLAAAAVDLPDWARLSPASITSSSVSPAVPAPVTLHVVDQQQLQHVPTPVVDDSLEALFSGPVLESASSPGVHPAASHDRDPTRFTSKTIGSAGVGTKGLLARATAAPTTKTANGTRATVTATTGGAGLLQKGDRFHGQASPALMPVANYSHSAWLAAVSAPKSMPSFTGSSGGGRQGSRASGSPLQTESAAVDAASREHDVDQLADLATHRQQQQQSLLLAQQQQQQQQQQRQQPHESGQHDQQPLSSIPLARRPSLPSIQSILSDKSTTPSLPLHLGGSASASSTSQHVSLHHHQAQSQAQQMPNAASHRADRRGSLLSLIEAASTLSSSSPPTNAATLPARTVWSPPPPSGMSMLHSITSSSSAAIDVQPPPSKRLRTMSYPSMASAASALAALPLTSSADRPLPPPYVMGARSVVAPLPAGNERRGSESSAHTQHPLPPPPPPPPPVRSVASGSRGKSIDFGTVFSSSTVQHPIPQIHPLPQHHQPRQYHPHNPTFPHHASYPSSQPATISHLSTTTSPTSKPKKRAASGTSATRRGSTSTRRPSKSHAADSLSSIPCLSIIPTTALGVPMPRVRGGRGRGRSGADEPSLPHPKDFFSAVLKSKDQGSGPPPSSSSLAHASTGTAPAQSLITSPQSPPVTIPAAEVPPIDQQYQAHLASVLPGSPPPGVPVSQQQRATLLGPMGSGDAAAVESVNGESVCGGSGGASVEQSFPMLTSGVTINFSLGRRVQQDGPSPSPAPVPTTSGPAPSYSFPASQHIPVPTSTAAGRRPSELTFNTSVPASTAGHLPSPFTITPLRPALSRGSNPTSPTDSLDHHHHEQPPSLPSNPPETHSPPHSPRRPQLRQTHVLSPYPTHSKAMFHVTSSLTVVHVACDPMPHDFASTLVLHGFSLEALQSQLAGRPISDLIHPADAYPILGLPTLRNMYLQQQQQGQPSPPASWSWTLRVCDGTRGYKPAKVEVALTEAGRVASVAPARGNEAVWLVTIVPEAPAADARAHAPTAVVVNGIAPFPNPVGGASAIAAEASQYVAAGSAGAAGEGAGGQHLRGQQYLV